MESLPGERRAHRTSEIIAGIRKQCIAGEIFPVYCGSAFKNKGVQLVLDGVLNFLPSPLDIPDVEGHAVGKEEEPSTRKASEDEPFSALAFKIAVHPFYGKLTFIRVYSGTVCSPGRRSLTRPRARRSASARSSRCTPTRKTRLTWRTLATSTPWSA